MQELEFNSMVLLCPLSLCFTQNTPQLYNTALVVNSLFMYHLLSLSPAPIICSDCNVVPPHSVLQLCWLSFNWPTSCPVPVPSHSRAYPWAICRQQNKHPSLFEYQSLFLSHTHSLSTNLLVIPPSLQFCAHLQLFSSSFQISKRAVEMRNEAEAARQKGDCVTKTRPILT